MVHFSGPFGHTDYMDYAMGLMTPWSFVPHHLLTFDDRMDLSQRLHNFAVSLYDVYFRHATVLPRQDEIAQRHFGHLVGECARTSILQISTAF